MFVLQQIFSFIVIGGLIRLLTLSISSKALRKDGLLILRYSLVLRIFTSLSWPFFLAASFYNPSGKTPEGSWIFTLIGVLLFNAWLQIFTFKVLVDSEKITIRGFWSGLKTLQWSEIKFIQEIPIAKQFVIQTNSGRSLKLSTWLSGAEELMLYALTRGIDVWEK